TGDDAADEPDEVIPPVDDPAQTDQPLPLVNCDSGRCHAIVSVERILMRILPGFKLKGAQFITSSGHAKPDSFDSLGNCPPSLMLLFYIALLNPNKPVSPGGNCDEVHRGVQSVSSRDERADLEHRSSGHQALLCARPSGLRRWRARFEDERTARIGCVAGAAMR